MSKCIYPQLSDWSAEPSGPQHSPNVNHTFSNHAEQNQLNDVEQIRSQFENGTTQNKGFNGSFVQGFVMSLITGGFMFTIFVPLYLSSKITNNQNVTTSAVPTQYVFWSFDQNANDLYNNYNGITVNTPSYVTGYTGLNSSALSLSSGSSQYMIVTSPFLNLISQSFTIEMWFYPTALTSSNFGLFGQCQSLTMDQCLVCMISNYSVYFSFYGDNQSGTTSITINNWYHVAFVYDSSTSTQSVYLNGFVEGSRTSNAYQGLNGSITIGATSIGPSNFFSGYIDQVSLVMRAKSASEILDDATLVCYYPFDSNSYYDSGPLGLNGSSVGLSAAIGLGRVNDATSLTSNGSYFVSGGMSKFGKYGQSYSISIWLKPTSVNGGTVLHVSKCNSICGSTWCVAFLGFTLSGQIVIQSWSNNLINGSHLLPITGPVLSTNIWTHIGYTYSSKNGIRLYVNGVLFYQSIPFAYSGSNTPNYIYLGNFPLTPCVTINYLTMGQYYGLIDEFRLYSREITAAEVNTLASP